MSSQQKRWRAKYAGKEGSESAVKAAVGSEGWAELSMSTAYDGGSIVGWSFVADNAWVGFDQASTNDGMPRLWAEDDELEFPDDPEVIPRRVEAMKKAILHVTNSITGPSFARYCELIPHFRGPRLFYFPETRIHLWHGLSSLAIQAMRELNAEGKLVGERAPFALYSIDGVSNSCMLLPRVQGGDMAIPQPRDSWLPLAFWTPEQIKNSGGKNRHERRRNERANPRLKEFKQGVILDSEGEPTWQKTGKESLMGQLSKEEAEGEAEVAPSSPTPAADSLPTRSENE